MNQVKLDPAPDSGPQSGIPIACDLHVFSEADRAAHFDPSTDALVRWPTKREELPDGYLFSCQGSEQRFLGCVGLGTGSALAVLGAIGAGALIGWGPARMRART